MLKQRTVKKDIHIEGIGLHTGKKINAWVKPKNENSGIIFKRVDLPGGPEIEAKPSNILTSGVNLQRTSIQAHGAEVHTIEHLMAALSAFGIDNAEVDIDGPELPGMDGSAEAISKLLKDAGFVEQDAPKRIIEIKKQIVLKLGDAVIEALPDTGFKASFFLEFKEPWLPDQSFSISSGSIEEFSIFFLKELAPSRTFCKRKDAIMLRLAGLGRGANFKNTLVMAKSGPIGNKLRFPDELARHKLCDLLGDLYLLGGCIKGNIKAVRSGHKLNLELVKEIERSLQ